MRSRYKLMFCPVTFCTESGVCRYFMIVLSSNHKSSFKVGDDIQKSSHAHRSDFWNCMDSRIPNFSKPSNSKKCFPRAPAELGRSGAKKNDLPLFPPRLHTVAASVVTKTRLLVPKILRLDPKILIESMTEGKTDEKPIEDAQVATGAATGGEKPDRINTGDDSGDKDDCSDLTDNNNPEGEEQAPKSFPQKLMDILSNEDNTEIISWLPHGNGFIINKKKTFANDVLPKYFKASKFTSFTRKLNRWGFTRVPRGPETGAYFHKLFRRDKPELCLQMTSNSGNKYQTSPMQQQLLPNGSGGEKSSEAGEGADSKPKEETGEEADASKEQDEAQESIIKPKAVDEV
ncbi:predicted protein [Phaeodactylum tricornutum CCAP 1055/1]|uniref:HSF-type DNA-binding domain-containing protein n=1 Tax=Phaeodactylum tricornutum (strain CCAP 1055/1) TaxID=556484 RepID=B7FUK9_PHATC|nr:predicted protein [Phaeodactylum tricornutum CCAP 1055/1]EEC50281.1 predicted protein [Phaeodactylum tricornutum CCAP 1055/1]|eukprot:XP_002178616.1 predicted protein [Phaeodactylum tricornutum CCAP 1055/1]